MPHEFGTNVCGVRIGMCCDSASLEEPLNRYLLPWTPREPLRSKDDLVFRVSAALEPDHFAIHCGETLVSRSEPWPQIFISLQHAVDDAILRSLRGFAMVHAGVVSVDGKAILLPGSSGAGKTTLVRELSHLGAEYFSDEYALLDTQGRVHPYPRALMVRDGEGIQQPALPGDLGLRVGAASSSAALVLVLHRNDADGLQLSRLNASEGLLQLLGNTPHVLAETPEILGPLQAAAARAVFYKGSRGEARRAAEEILKLAESV